MTPALLSVCPSLQRIKFLTCTCPSASASAAGSGPTGHLLCWGCGLFKAPPLGLALPPGPRLWFLGGGVASSLANGRAGSLLRLGGGACLSSPCAPKGVAPPSRHRGRGYVWVTWRLPVWSDFGGYLAWRGGGDHPGDCGSGGGGRRQRGGRTRSRRGLAVVSAPGCGFPGAATGGGKGTWSERASPAGPARG